jgi:exopolysaccharide biosynthesis protein
LRGLLFFSPLIILTCASISPVDSDRERPASFSAIEEVRPQWQAFTGNIGYFHGTVKKPKLDFWALRIDLLSPQTRIAVKGGTVDGGRTLSTRVSSFVRDNGLSAGINAVPFDISSANENSPIQNIGVVISGGELIAPANQRYDALVFYKDGRTAVVSQSAIKDSIEDIENAVGGFFSVLKNGQPEERTLNLQPRHPRSAAGISNDGRYLYLLVIDGRRSGSIGGTEEETALLLRSLGSWDGINFDGGGSSALVLRYPDGKIRPVNTPIHDGIPGQERAVAGCLGVY